MGNGSMMEWLQTLRTNFSASVTDYTAFPSNALATTQIWSKSGGILARNTDLFYSKFQNRWEYYRMPYIYTPWYRNFQKCCSGGGCLPSIGSVTSIVNTCKPYFIVLNLCYKSDYGFSSLPPSRLVRRVYMPKYPTYSWTNAFNG